MRSLGILSSLLGFFRLLAISVIDVGHTALRSFKPDSTASLDLDRAKRSHDASTEAWDRAKAFMARALEHARFSGGSFVQPRSMGA